MATSRLTPFCFSRTIRFCPTSPAPPVMTTLSLGFISARLEARLLEDRFGHGLDDGHDPAPEPGRVHDILALDHRSMDSLGDDFRRCPQEALLECRGHRSIDKSGLD